MRTFQHTTPAQVTNQVRLNIGVAEIAVYAEKRPDITVTLAPARATDTIAADLIERAENRVHDDVFSVTVPRSAGRTYGGQTTVVQSGRTVSVSGGRVRNVVGGMVIVNGQIITGSDGTAVNGESGGLIRAILRVPVGANVEIRADVADTTTHGTLGRLDHDNDAGDLTVQTAAELHAKSVAGDISAGLAIQAFATTASGDVEIESTSSASLTTISGDIRVDAAAGSVRCTAVSGDVTVHAVADADVAASSISGDVRVTHAPGVTVQAQLGSVSGRVRGPKEGNK